MGPPLEAEEVEVEVEAVVAVADNGRGASPSAIAPLALFVYLLPLRLFARCSVSFFSRVSNARSSVAFSSGAQIREKTAEVSLALLALERRRSHRRATTTTTQDGPFFLSSIAFSSPPSLALALAKTSQRACDLARSSRKQTRSQHAEKSSAGFVAASLEKQRERRGRGRAKSEQAIFRRRFSQLFASHFFFFFRGKRIEALLLLLFAYVSIFHAQRDRPQPPLSRECCSALTAPSKGGAKRDREREKSLCRRRRPAIQKSLFSFSLSFLFSCCSASSPSCSQTTSRSRRPTRRMPRSAR